LHLAAGYPARIGCISNPAEKPQTLHNFLQTYISFLIGNLPTTNRTNIYTPMAGILVCNCVGMDVDVGADVGVGC